jgi:hypothetical protein
MFGLVAGRFAAAGGVLTMNGRQQGSLQVLGGVLITSSFTGIDISFAKQFISEGVNCVKTRREFFTQ